MTPEATVTPTQQIVSWFIMVLPYAMTVVFLAAVGMRTLVYYTMRRHEWFAKEFEKRVNIFLEGQQPGKVKQVSFYSLSKKYLEKTFFETFEVRDRMRRRKPDPVMSLTDRVFLVKHGCAWLVKDILRQVKFIKWSGENPKLLNITKATFSRNPCFNRVFGIIPIGGLNDLLSLLPGLFVVAGILGTFLGIKGGLSSLGTMSLENLEGTKKIMDQFLGEISFAMTASIVGIAYSLILHVFNTALNPERSFMTMVDRFEAAMDLLWYRSDNNEYPAEDAPFDENQDPNEVLARDALNLEIAKAGDKRDLVTPKVKAS